MSPDPLKAPAGDDAAGAGATPTSEAAPRASDVEANPDPDGLRNGEEWPAGHAEEQPEPEAPAPRQPEPEASAPRQPEPEAPEAPADPAEAYALAGEELKALTVKADKADEYLQLAQRTQADFENYRKRAARETAIAKERGATKLALELLPAVDNLERALAHAPAGENGEDGAFVSGIKHVHSDVIAALQRAGIERYSPEGEPFDPTLHEAVAQQPVEGFEAGTVVEVFQRGYRIGDTVVRPARVVVAG